MSKNDIIFMNYIGGIYMKINGIFNKKVYIGIIVILAIILTSVIGFNIFKSDEGDSNSELLVARKYEQVKVGDEAIDGTEFVTFDAFYLRDLDGDGYAEKIRGTCKEIGTQDTLYMDLNVLTNGTLKDAKITINGKNFYFATALVKDSVIAQDYISTNLREIKLNDVNNGTQKLIFGMVQSGDYSYSGGIAKAIGNNTSKYTITDNSITLTGTHVADDGTETPISKTVYLTNDWYGTTVTELNSRYDSQEYNIENALDVNNSTVNVIFKVNPIERQKQLIIANQHLELEVPELAGYKAIDVKVNNDEVVVNYDAEIGKVTIDLNAGINESNAVTKTVSKDITYEITYVYPYEAFEKADKNGFTLNIPIDATYTGYNNLNKQFQNPYVSNVAEQVISVLYGTPRGENAIVEVKVGEYSTDNYVVSKELPLNIYNNIENEDTIDEYIVRWQIDTGTQALNVPVILNEPSTNYTDKFLDVNANYSDMLDYIENVGIYFQEQEFLLGENGYINVYNNDTNELLHTFTKDDWNKYTKSNPYRYSEPVEHIRIETSNVLKSATLYVYNVKEIDDIKLTADYTEEQFDKLNEIYSYLEGYMKLENGELFKLDEASSYAKYQEPYSQARLSINESYISNQETKKGVILSITTDSNEYVKKKWQNGEFLIKYPAEIIDININSVTSEDKDVVVTGVETYEENGNLYTKIYTSNKIAKDLNIKIDADITADPRVETMTRNIEMYYYNKACSNYYSSSRAEDKYDINGNENIAEYVGYTSISANIMAPSNLLTSQTAKDFDDIGSIIVAPQEATIDKVDGTKTATVNINITNNYSNTISEVKIVGKIPFKDNTYQINGAKLGSTFTTIMSESGIVVPDELKAYTTVYYSYKENVTDDINDNKNGWTTAPDDMSKVKNYLIDLGNYVMPVDNTKVFNYEIKIPSGIDYNEVSYSAHAVYYCLDTDQGKLKTQTEPNKLGFRIAEKYDLEITKFEKNSNNVISGVVFSATEVGSEESKFATTYSSGIATIKNLYVEREYIIKEIKTNDNYVLNTTETKIIAHIVDGELQIEILEGGFKTTPIIEVVDNSNTKAKVSIENEVKYNFVLNKTQADTNELLQGIRFELTDYNGQVTRYATNKNGQLTLKLLEPNKQYTLREKEAKGYYLKEPVSFMMIRDENGELKFNVLSGNLDNLPSLSRPQEVPVVTAELKNEKVPTYSLKIVKKEVNTETVLKGVQFKLESNDYEGVNIYTTGEDGTIQIDGLYQFSEGKNITGEYTLQEIYPSEGYVLNTKPIVFKAKKDATDNLKLEIISGKIRESIEDIQVDYTNPDNPVISITIDNNPIFTLTKVDAETKQPLEGVEFKVTDLDGNDVIDANGKLINNIKTDANGKATLSLKEGLYNIIEQKTLDGYELLEEPVKIGIGESKEPEYILEATKFNTEYSDNYSIEAHPFENGFYTLSYGLSDDVVFTVFDKQGEFVKSKVLDFDSMYVRESYLVDDGIIFVDIGDYDYDFGTITKSGRIFKLDFEGNTVWENTEFYGLFEKSISLEDGIIFTVSGESEGNYVAKINKYGEIEWYIRKSCTEMFITQNQIITIGSEIASYDFNGKENWNISTGNSYYDFIETTDGFFVLGMDDISKIDFNGNIIWQNNTGYSYEEFLVLNDNLYLFAYTGVITKINGQTGEKIWQDFSYASYFVDRAVEWNGNILLILTDYSNPNTVLLLNEDATVLWENSTVEFAPNGGNIVTFEQDDGMIISADNYATTVKVDYNGNYVWKKSPLTTIEISEYNDTLIIEGDSKVTGIDKLGNIVFQIDNFTYELEYIDKVADGFATITEYGYNVFLHDSNGEVLWKRGNTTRYSYVKGVSDGIVLYGYYQNIKKYDLNGNEMWKYSSTSKTYSSVCEVADGGLIFGGNKGIDKFNANGSIEWSITDSATGVVATNDGFIGYKDGIVKKYDLNGTLKWENSEYTGTISDMVNFDNELIAISESGDWIRYSLDGSKISEKDLNISIGYWSNLQVTDDGILIPDGGYVSKVDKEGNIIISTKNNRFYLTDSVEIENGTIAGTSDVGIVFLDKVIEEPEIPALQQITIENNLIKYEITTQVKGFGGTISGRGEKPYEEVVYKNNSIKDIIITPDSGYKVKTITINNKPIEFTENTDGTVILDKFIEMTEDKEIVVSFYNYESTLIINKVDSITNKLLSDCIVNIKEIDERNDPDLQEIIKDIDGNSIYHEPNYENEITDAIGEVTKGEETYYFIENANGGYESNNALKKGTKAVSYVTIDLKNYTGIYNLIVNASISCGYSNSGFVTLTETNVNPGDDNTVGRIVYMDSYSDEQGPEDYITQLEGGKEYYLYFGYYKSNYASTEEDDKFYINSIKLYGDTASEYKFIKNVNGGYEPNNQGVPDTIATSYIPLDLTNYKGKYNLIINASISSESGDRGYAILSQTTNSPSSYKTRIFDLYGGEIAAQDYTTIVEGGKKYYLHVFYSKDSSVDSGLDKLIINSINLTLNTDDLVDTEITTDANGEASIELKNGKYQITELRAPNGYTLNSNPIIVDFVAGNDNLVTIKNVPQTDVLVHHYIKGTTIPVAEDEYIKGDIGKEYSTSPKLNLEKYQLVKNEDGTYQIPENAVGIFTEEIQEVTFYYEEKPLKLIVHHYLDGTEDSVADDEVSEGMKGENYVTSPVEPPILGEKYNLVTNKIPENAIGTLEEQVTEVIYYYDTKTYNLELTKIDEVTKEVLPGITFELSNDWDSNTSVTSENGKLNYYSLYIGTEYTLKEINLPEGYALNEANKNVKFIAEFDDNKNLIFSITQGDLIRDISINTENGSYNVVANIVNKPSFILEKQGRLENKLLENAKFIIKKVNSDGTEEDAKDINGNLVGTIENINGVEYRVVTTNSEGKIGLKLAAGDYKAIEVAAPNGYILPENEDERTYEFTIEPAEDIKELRFDSNKGINLNVSNRFGVIGTIDGGYVEVGATYSTLTIPSDETVNNEQIVIPGQSRSDGIIIKYNSNGLVEWVESIESNSDGASNNLIVSLSQNSKGESVVLGVFTGTITIPAEETSNGVELQISTDKNMSEFIIKYDSNMKVEWIKTNEVFSTNSSSGFYGNIKLHDDGSFIVSLPVDGDITIPATCTASGEALDISTTTDVVAIEFNSQGLIEYGNEIKVKSSGGIGYSLETKSAQPLTIENDIIGLEIYNSILVNDNYKVGVGYISGTVIIQSEFTADGTEIVLSAVDDGYDGVIVKYNSENKIVWAKKLNSIGSDGDLSLIEETEDGYLATGYFAEGIHIAAADTVNQNEIIIENTGNTPVIIKYNEEGKVSFVSILENIDSGDMWDGTIDISAAGDYCYVTDINNRQIITFKKIAVGTTGIKDQVKLIVKNNPQQFKITTEVEGANGTISGLTENPYETVYLEEDSVKDIIVMPDSGYQIEGITVNGQAIEFTPSEDGTYKLDKFIAMTEDKHIVVKFERKDTSIIVKHQTEDGRDLVEPETVNGKVGDEYTTTEKEFADYDIKTIPDNANGTMTEEQIEVIYVYSQVKGKITVTKVDISDTNTKLTGATFKLEKLDADGNVDTTFTAQEKTTGTEGTAVFTELLVGKYQVTETKAPEGYELNTEVTEVEVTKANRELNVTVKNREKLTLPETGKINYTIVISGIGLAVMLVAVLIKKFKSTKVN